MHGHPPESDLVRGDAADPRWDRLIHLVAGELAADEAAALRQWIEADASRRAALARLEAIWTATAPADDAVPETWDADAELGRIRRDTGAGRVIARVGSDFERIQGRRSWVGIAVRVAAMMALLAGGMTLWRLRAPEPAGIGASVAMAEYRTAPGERLSLRLPDGTQVMLAPGGVLRRPSDYGLRERVVQLEGEGYFVVTHDSTRPFAVHTRRAIARDLGTRFVVRAYANELMTDILVTEGKVAVAPPSTAGREVLLTAGERAQVDDAGRSAVTVVADVAPYVAWTEGRLVFDRTPLLDVVRQLERWYGIEIELADPSLRRLRLTATLQEEHAAQALDLVATSLELALSQSGTTYRLDRSRPRP